MVISPLAGSKRISVFCFPWLSEMAALSNDLGFGPRLRPRILQINGAVLPHCETVQQEQRDQPCHSKTLLFAGHGMPSYQRNPKSIETRYADAVFAKCVRTIVLPFVEICQRLRGRSLIKQLGCQTAVGRSGLRFSLRVDE
jgi:hypothetical protein